MAGDPHGVARAGGHREETPYCGDALDDVDDVAALGNKGHSSVFSRSGIKGHGAGAAGAGCSALN